MAEIMDGKELAENRAEWLSDEVAALKSRGIEPGLAAVLIGHDPASQFYVRKKAETAEELGIHSLTVELPENVSYDEIWDVMQSLNTDSRINGILFQLPLPSHLNRYAIIEHMDPLKDVDCLHPYNIGNLVLGNPLFEPCTPKGIVNLLDEYEIKTEEREIVVLGRSDIVGRPLSIMLSNRERNATVTLAHSYTNDLETVTRRADILVSAIGCPEEITADMVKEGAVVIDVGINRIEDTKSQKGYRLVGDVDFDAVCEKASHITPVPGGVGPMTVMSLMENTICAAELQASESTPRLAHYMKRIIN